MVGLPPMFDPAKILRPLLGGLAGLMQRKVCLVRPFLYSVRYTCSFKLSFMWYPQCLIQPIIGALIGAPGATRSRGSPADIHRRGSRIQKGGGFVHSEGGGGVRTGISGADPNCCRALGKSTSKTNCRQP